MTPAHDARVPCTCCHAPMLVIAGRSYLPGPVCEISSHMRLHAQRLDAEREAEIVTNPTATR